MATDSHEGKGEQPTEETVLDRLRSTHRRFPDGEAAHRMQETHRAAINRALDARVDPFGRNDIVVLESSNAPGLRIPLQSLPAVVGRDQAKADFIVGGRGVSSAHFRLEREGPFVVIRDLASTNGTFVNDRQVEREYLCEGDKITVGFVDLIVRRG
jgi:hypothetical protein